MRDKSECHATYAQNLLDDLFSSADFNDFIENLNLWLFINSPSTMLIQISIRAFHKTLWIINLNLFKFLRLPLHHHFPSSFVLKNYFVNPFLCTWRRARWSIKWSLNFYHLRAFHRSLSAETRRQRLKVSCFTMEINWMRHCGAFLFQIIKYIWLRLVGGGEEG